MEVDVIILPKNGSKQELQLGMKQEIKTIFKMLYIDVQDECFQFDLEGELVKINYQLSSKNNNMVFAKFECEYTSIKSAKVLDCCINKLVQGEHRKDWNIVITYDEVSQLYCCKLMPFFGTFERRTRELVYITVIKIFGVEWYEKSFSESMKNTLKSKGNKTKLVEGALNELTYEQLKEYLFVPYCSQNLSDVLGNELSKERMEGLSKEEIASILDNCRSVSLWDRFFGKYKRFQNFKERIDELQLYRNMVMHHKRITQQEYEKVKKSLKSVNKLLSDAINVLEEDIYTETRLVDVVSALGNMISGILGDYVPTWVDNMKSSLASLGRVVIEAAMPQINIPEVMPKLTLGSELFQYFQSVYNVPQINTSLIEATKVLYNTPGIKMASEMAAQATQISSMYDVPGIKNMMEAVETFNTPSVRLLEMAECANKMNAIFSMPIIEHITSTTSAMNFCDQEVVDGAKDDEEQLPIDLSDSVDENS